MIFYIFWSIIIGMRVKSYLGLKFGFSHCNFLCADYVHKNVSLGLPLPPPPFSLLSKISLIKAANTYFSQFINRRAEFIRFCGFLYKFVLFKRRETAMIWK